MRFLSFSIENFGVFEETTFFQLAPRSRSTKHGNIVLIHGHNGSGKSTVFKALDLAIHGKISLGGRVTQQEYEDYILNRLHKRKGNGISHNEARLKLELELSLSGVFQIISIERYWFRAGNSIKEGLDILLDGRKPRLRPEDYQDWLNSLIHPGTIQSVFFDAEQLENFADPEKHDEQLKNTLDRLLGLDLIARLQDDLMSFLLNDTESHFLKNLKKEYKDTEVQLKELEKDVYKKQDTLNRLMQEKHRYDHLLETLLQQYTVMGGNFLMRRPQIEKEIAEIELQIKRLRGDIKGYCSDVFPFALAPGITKKFIDHLKKEKLVKIKRHAKEYYQAKKETLIKKIIASSHWEELGIAKDSYFLPKIRFIVTILNEELDIFLDDEALVYDLSDSDFSCYEAWIERALYHDSPKVRELSICLKDFEKKLEEHESELQQSPDESWAKQQQQKIDEAKTAIGSIEQKITDMENEISNTRAEIVRVEQKQNNTVNNLGNFFAQEKRTDLARRAQGALGTYREVLRRNKVMQLESAFTKIFNHICRKTSFIKGISINPENFSTYIEDSNGQLLTLDQLSAAERQLYVYSIIAGIHEVSGLPLPLVIDTPLARFDKTHRGRLIKEFFPFVSDQVILFTTDEEETTFRENGGLPSTLFSYKISYCEETAKTTANQILQEVS